MSTQEDVTHLPPAQSPGPALPVTAAIPPPAAPPAGAILVVDDNPANRDALSRRLERRGYHVTTAEDGPSALGLCAQRPFDLVLLDVMMPGMNGLEVLQRLR